MPARLRHVKLAHDAYTALLEADRLARGPLEPLLVELVRLRASQINGCAFCVDLHARDARALGETETRLHLLAAWREASCFTERERAALAWTESLTLVADTRVPDDVFALAKAHFSDEEIVRLAYVVSIINAWNRLNVAFRTPEKGAPKPAPEQGQPLSPGPGASP